MYFVFRYYCGGSVVDVNFESCGILVYKLDGVFCFDSGNGSIYIFGYYFFIVEYVVFYILVMIRVIFDYLVGGFKVGIFLL